MISIFAVIAGSACSSRNSKETKKIENIDSLIIVHKNDMLFLDFWFGMTRVQYKIVEEKLRSGNKLRTYKLETKNNTIFKKYYIFNIDDKIINAFLLPKFINDSLKELVLEFTPETEKTNPRIIDNTGVPEWLVKQINIGRAERGEYGDIEYTEVSSYDNIANVLTNFYKSKYNDFECYDFAGGTKEYLSDDGKKLLLIHEGRNKYKLKIGSKPFIKVNTMPLFVKSSGVKKNKSLKIVSKYICDNYYIKYANSKDYWRRLDATETNMNDEKSKEMKKADSLKAQTLNDI